MNLSECLNGVLLGEDKGGQGFCRSHFSSRSLSIKFLSVQGDTVFMCSLQGH